MARREGPALYELLGSKREGGDPGKGEPPRSPLGAPRGLSPSDVRGLLAAVSVVAALVVGYFIGLSRGEHIGRAAISQAEQEAIAFGGAVAMDGSQTGAGVNGQDGQAPVAAAGTRPENPTRNGLARGGSLPAAGNSGAGVPQGGIPAGSADGIPAGSADGALGPAPEGIDPREAGLQYFVICSTLEANAQKVVAFCRARGLDAHVVPDQNGRLREVTVLPGFGASERSSATVRELEDRIRRVGVLWKAAGRGNSDFGDRYIRTHRP